MRITYYVLISIFIAHSSTFLQARYIHSKFSKKNTVENTTITWWPRNTYQNSQNNISLTIRALSEIETSNLFLGKGKFLVAMRGCLFISHQPIIPLHLVIKNENSFSIMLSKEGINLGKNWIGIKHRPINLANIYESLNNYWIWSSPIEIQHGFIHSYTGNLVGTTTNYKKNENPLIDCSFLMLDRFSLSSLLNLEASIISNLASNSVIVEQGKTIELLLFVWGKQITPNFSITIAQTNFKINLHTYDN
jgi:hypothetical protein